MDGAKRRARANAYAEPAERHHDGRLRAAVIADPFTAPFPDATLRALPPVKLLFLRPETEDMLKAEYHVSRVVRLLRQRDDFPEPRDVQMSGAGHFSFIAPIPEEIGKSLAGARRFDRETFQAEMSRRTALHEVMNRTIVIFLKQSFTEGAEEPN